MDASEHEAGFVKFMLRERRARALELLSNPKRRKKQLDQLDHHPDLDPKYCVAIPPSRQRREDIERILRDHGAPSSVYVISSWGKWDGQFLDLAEALREVTGYGMGTVLSCIPGKLAYYEGEGPKDRCILKRDG